MAESDSLEELIARIALGDRTAFSRLYDRTAAKLFGLILRVLNNRSEAEDVLQETFIKVWQNSQKYRINGLSPMTWMITIARNSAIDRLRARRPSEDIADHLDIADQGQTPEQAILASRETARLSACLAQLEEDRAAAVRGAYLDGASYEDLARRFKVPLNTMRTWLRRSLLRLRECLAP